MVQRKGDHLADLLPPIERHDQPFHAERHAGADLRAAAYLIGHRPVGGVKDHGDATLACILPLDDPSQPFGVGLFLKTVGDFQSPRVQFPSPAVRGIRDRLREGGHAARILVDDRTVVVGQARLHRGQPDAVEYLLPGVVAGGAHARRLRRATEAVPVVDGVQIDPGGPQHGVTYRDAVERDRQRSLGRQRRHEPFQPGHLGQILAAGRIPLQHGELRTVRTVQLGAVAERGGELEDRPRAQGDEPAHVAFRRRAQVQRQTFVPGAKRSRAMQPRCEHLDGRLRQQRGRSERRAHLEVPGVGEEGADGRQDPGVPERASKRRSRHGGVSPTGRLLSPRRSSPSAPFFGPFPPVWKCAGLPLARQSGTLLYSRVRPPWVATHLTAICA